MSIRRMSSREGMKEGTQNEMVQNLNSPEHIYHRLTHL